MIVRIIVQVDLIILVGLYKVKNGAGVGWKQIKKLWLLATLWMAFAMGLGWTSIGAMPTFTIPTGGGVPR